MPIRLARARILRRMANHFISGRLARIAPLFGWIVVCCAPTANAADLVDPGQYEWTMKTNADAPRVISTCVTPEVAAMSNGDSRTGREAAEKAKRADARFRSTRSRETTCPTASPAATRGW